MYKENKKPKMSARHLADYMAASEQRRRSLIRECKYPQIARVVQHKEAKSVISNFLRLENPDTTILQAKADSIRTRMADSDFDQVLYDSNADYIEKFIENYSNLEFPKAEFVKEPKKWQDIEVGGVKITVDVAFELSRITKSNIQKYGIGSLRYSKGKPLNIEAGYWQSSLLLGYLKIVNQAIELEPEPKLCITLDAYSGAIYQAPSDSVSRFKNIEAACYAISERWENISPPSH